MLYQHFSIIKKGELALCKAFKQWRPPACIFALYKELCVLNVAFVRKQTTFSCH